MSVKMESKNGDLVAYLSGEIDHHTAKFLREQVDIETERLSPPCLWLNFRDVTFMDSSGVGLIMGRYRLMRQMGGKLVISSANDRVRRMLQMAGLDKLDIWEKETAK